MLACAIFVGASALASGLVGASNLLSLCLWAGVASASSGYTTTLRGVAPTIANRLIRASYFLNVCFWAR